MTRSTFERSAGVLLHVTSLPGPYGIGDVGPTAHRWVDWLSATGTRYWQVLPLGPPGFGESPYSSYSSHACNVDLISPEALVEEGLLQQSELTPIGSTDRIDHRAVRTAKGELTRLAKTRLSGDLAEAFAEFRRSETSWLRPYALFMALKSDHGGGSWTGWQEELRDLEESALSAEADRLSTSVEFHEFEQFLVHTQLERLHRHAAARGVAMIGDMPLYVAPDSVEVWLEPELFAVDETGEPTHVAGVPPDQFSETGQRWGNPLYRWGRHAIDGYSWWKDRFRAFLRHADVLRIDHFTGLATYYEIEASNPTAMNGTWHDGPGKTFFDELEDSLGPLPVILEDLGPAGQPVEDLRLEVGYPGIVILQDRYQDEGPYPTVARDRVVYTGTHDYDTALGRLNEESDSYRRRALQDTGSPEATYPWGLVEAAWSSPGIISIANQKNLLGLGAEARMNRPGTTQGNWLWRMPPGSASDELSARLSELNRRTGRSA